MAAKFSIGVASEIVRGRKHRKSAKETAQGAIRSARRQTKAVKKIAPLTAPRMEGEKISPAKRRAQWSAAFASRRSMLGGDQKAMVKRRDHDRYVARIGRSGVLRRMNTQTVIMGAIAFLCMVSAADWVFARSSPAAACASVAFGAGYVALSILFR